MKYSKQRISAGRISLPSAKDFICRHDFLNAGHTIVFKAISVNTLQDTWTNLLPGAAEFWGICWEMGQRPGWT